MSLEFINLCKRFVEIRKSKKINQSVYADLLGTTRSNIASIEAGRNTPNGEIIHKLIVELQVSPAYLFFGVGPIENEEWNMFLDAGQIEKKVLEKLQNTKETSFYKTIFSALSTTISVQVFLCIFFKKVDSIGIVQPQGAKQKLVDLLVDFEKEYSNIQLLPSNVRYLSKKDREIAIAFVQENFDDDEAYFMLKNAKKIQTEIKKEIPHIHKIFNC